MAIKHSGNWKQSIFTGYRLRAVCGCAIDQWGGSEKPTDSKKEKNDMLAASISAKLLIWKLINLQYFFYYNTISLVPCQFEMHIKNEKNSSCNLFFCL